MNRRLLLSVAAVLLVLVLGIVALYAVRSFWPATPRADIGWQYELEPLPALVVVGEPIHAEWVAHADQNYTPFAETTLCFALFGPWPDAGAAKDQIQATQTREPVCPPTGAHVSSAAVRMTSTGQRLQADSPGVAAPGFYILRQLNISRRVNGGISASNDRIVEARARTAVAPSPSVPLGQVNTCGTVVAYAADGAQMQVTLAGAAATRKYRLEFQFAVGPYPRDIGTLLSAQTAQLVSISGQEVPADSGTPDAVNLQPFTIARVTACAFGVPVPVTPVPQIVSIRGTVNWNHHPLPDIEVLLSDTGAPMSCIPSAARSRTLTIANGLFQFYVGLPANPSVGVFVCATGLYEDGGHAITVNGSNVDAGSIDLARTMTGLSIKDGDRVPSGPLTITWDVVPEATAYCVAVWSTTTGYQGPTCLPGVFGERIATNSFTTPSLRSDVYTMSVAALTDVVIGTRANRALAFTVAAP